MKSAYFDLFFTVVIPAIVVVLVVALILGADSLDAVVFGR